MEILGIDIGGTGIKGALVRIETGQLASERYRLPTPKGGCPNDIASVVQDIVKYFSWQGRVGITMPVRIRNGIACTAANIDDSWIGLHVDALFSDTLGCKVTTLNDADAAGCAEIHYGAGRNIHGKVLVLTIGTGIGTSLFMRSALIPNLELGHLRMSGKVAENWTSNRVRKRKNLSWKVWAKRFQKYLTYVEFLLDPDVIILGGGISRPKRREHYFHLLKTKAQLLPAQFQNEAGIIGAACATRVN